jgi:hypothetical protein
MSRRSGANLLLSGLILGFLLGLAPGVRAANPVVPIPGVALRVDATLEDNLKALAGRQVTVTLDSGVQIGGRVKSVGTGLLHLETLSGRSFMDALVRIERIQALDTQVRAYESDLKRLK